MRNNNAFRISPVWKAQAEGYDWGLRKRQQPVKSEYLLHKKARVNYNTLNSFQMECARINCRNPEDCVGATWSVILGTIFPAFEGDYAVEPQARSPGGYTDFTICDWVGSLRRLLFVVETKKAPRGRRRPGWRSAESQLRQYLRGWGRTARQGQTARATCYGAIAIGTDLRFDEYSDEKDYIERMRYRIQPYEVNNDAQTIIQLHQHIKDNHN